MTRIRAATEADLDALLRLNAVVQGWHAKTYPNRFKAKLDEGALRAFFLQVLTDAACHLRIADDASGYLFARFHVGRDSFYGVKPAGLHIEHIAVLPERQRDGIGSALMHDAEALARSLGGTTLTLDSWAANHDAHMMFAAMGLVPVRHHYAKTLT